MFAASSLLECAFVVPPLYPQKWGLNKLDMTAVSHLGVSGPEPAGFREISQGCRHPRNPYKYRASRSDATGPSGLLHALLNAPDAQDEREWPAKHAKNARNRTELEKPKSLSKQGAILPSWVVTKGFVFASFRVFRGQPVPGAWL